MQNETHGRDRQGHRSSDRVVTTGFARLKDGARVTVAKPEEQQSGRARGKAGSARELSGRACAA